MVIRDVTAYWMRRLKRGMATGECESAISRRGAPELCIFLRLEKSEGAGKAGCPLHP
jgi:hypothetical protein